MQESKDVFCVTKIQKRLGSSEFLNPKSSLEVGNLLILSYAEHVDSIVTKQNHAKN